MTEILWFETTQCMVRVYDAQEELVGERLYMVQSHHIANGEILIRFGTRKQLLSMLKAYKFSSFRQNKKTYEMYLEALGSAIKYFDLKEDGE